MDDSMTTATKFEKVLKGFLHENFKVLNDVYIEMLLSHLSGKSDKDYSKLLETPFLLEWFETCYEILQEDYKKLNPQVIAFMLRLLAFFTTKEWAVINIRERRLVDKIQFVLEKNQHNLSAIVKLGHIHFLKAIAVRSLGVGWINSVNAWKPIIEYSKQNQTIYVSRESREFISDYLYRVSLYSEKTQHEELIVQILTEILQPLIESIYEDNVERMNVNVDDTDLQYKLAPILNLMCHILKNTLEKNEKIKIIYYLETKFNFERNLWKLADMTRNEEFMCKILHTLTCYNYALLIYEKWNGDPNNRIASEDFNKFGVNFFNSFKFSISKKCCYNAIRLTELNHILWKKLQNRVPEEIQIENERVEFENQILFFHLMPVLFVLKNTQKQACTEIFDNYLSKLFTISCSFTQRICYEFRDVLYNSEWEFTLDLANKAIHGILSLENVLNRDRASVVFTAMIYALKEFSQEGNIEEMNIRRQNNEIESDPLVRLPNVLFAILIGLQTLIQRYHITWKESIESICLVNFSLELLNNPNLTSRLAVQAIKLTQISIEHFLSPNLALLVENLNGTAMQNLGPMIVKRLHDNAWEVRDSVIELVTSMTDISQLKFPAFQQILIDNGVCPIVFSMAKNDSEPYVRASALTCLSKMVVINTLWENSLNSFDFVDHLLATLSTESEGIVRKEAVRLLTKIYQHRKIPNEKTNCMFSTMTHCAVNDLHWEVKINCLLFWKSFICKQFHNQGVIDGTFPTVTFSKEKKKIITLTEKEILLRIDKILNDLSNHGCLGVILECLNDDCDLEVVKVAAVVAKKLFEFITHYDYIKVINGDVTNFNYHNESRSNSICSSSSSSGYVTSPSSSVTSPEIFDSIPSIQNDESIEKKNENESPNSDNVIDSIIESHDINLLAMAYQSQMHVNCGTNKSTIDEYLYKKFAEIKPREFISRINSMDLNEIIQKRNDWIINTDSLDSLLDDILFSIQTLDINVADCY